MGIVDKTCNPLTYSPNNLRGLSESCDLKEPQGFPGGVLSNDGQVAPRAAAVEGPAPVVDAPVQARGEAAPLRSDGVPGCQEGSAGGFSNATSSGRAQRQEIKPGDTPLRQLKCFW